MISMNLWMINELNTKLKCSFINEKYQNTVRKVKKGTWKSTKVSKRLSKRKRNQILWKINCVQHQQSNRRKLLLNRWLPWTHRFNDHNSYLSSFFVVQYEWIKRCTSEYVHNNYPFGSVCWEIGKLQCALYM